MSVLVGIALVSGACSDSGDAPTEPVTRQPEAIELAVRVHLVQSDQLDALNVRLSETEVAQLMTAVNETWAQPGSSGAWRASSGRMPGTSSCSFVP